MNTKIRQRVEANSPAERKEFAGKAQMPEVLRSVIDNAITDRFFILSSDCQDIMI
ncbi:MAG: hypothetical protein LBD27_03950 [Tannerella sp.]|jgi:hypothetical protein|nr:hypothetical protein [Tannerella sp.]